MAIRPQPYRLKWPLTPSQVEGVDEMFGILFKNAAQAATAVSTVTTVINNVSNVPGRDGESVDDSPSWPTPGMNSSSVYVPYTGATSAVDLGSRSLTTLGALEAGALYGGSTTTSALLLRATRAVGIAGAEVKIQVGSSGGTTALTAQFDGKVQINQGDLFITNSATVSDLNMGAGAVTYARIRLNNSSGDVHFVAQVDTTPKTTVYAWATGDWTFPAKITATGTITGTLATAAQTAITSVGTLTSLAVTGAVTAAGSTFTVPALALVSTDGLVVINTTAATGGATVQLSPRLRFRGNAWDTAATETVDGIIELLPVSLATPRGTMRIGFSINGGAVTYPFTLASTGLFTTTGAAEVGATEYIDWTGRALLRSPANGNTSFSNNAESIGVRLKHDALPTVNSGFGTGAAVTAGSTPMAGSINVGTGGIAVTGVIDFNGTAFPSAPFVIVMNDSTAAVVRATASTTQLTITAPLAFIANDVISWICIGARA